MNKCVRQEKRPEEVKGDLLMIKEWVEPFGNWCIVCSDVLGE